MYISRLKMKSSDEMMKKASNKNRGALSQIISKMSAGVL